MSSPAPFLLAVAIAAVIVLGGLMAIDAVWRFRSGHDRQSGKHGDADCTGRLTGACRRES